MGDGQMLSFTRIQSCSLSHSISISWSTSMEPPYISSHLINSVSLNLICSYSGPRRRKAMLAPWDRAALGWHCGYSWRC